MARTLLQMVKAAASRMTAIDEGFISLVNNTSDTDSVRVLALANAQIASMVNIPTASGGWRALEKVHSFTTISGQNQYDLPDDFHYQIPTTHWDSADQDIIRGPVNPQEIAYLKSYLNISMPHMYYRLIGNKIELYPTPTETGRTISFYYISKCAVLNFNNVDCTEQFENDTDTILLDEECFILGLMWRWKAVQGLDFSVEKSEYDARMETVIARDNGMRQISLGGRPNYDTPLIGYWNIPENGYGS